MSGSWSNDTSSLIILIEEVSGFSGIFGYSPAPGAGHLVFSVAAAAGTDPYGNKYVAGVTVYDESNLLFANMQAGKFLWGQIVGGAVDFTDAGELGANSAGDTVVTGSNQALTAFTDAVQLRLVAGEPNQHGGLNFAPYLLMLDTAGTSQVDFGLSGAVVHTNLQGAFVPWQTPVLGAGWSAANIRGALPLQYRIDAEDNLVVKGSVSVTSTTPATGVFTVVAPYAPTGDYALQEGLILKQNSSGLGFAFGHGFINSGVVSQNGLTFTLGDIVSFDFSWPLGNIA
jgi:hypothetical protein